MYNIYIRSKAYLNILKGIKKYELRLYRGIFRDIKKGDVVNLCNKDLNLKVEKKIESIIQFTDFKKMFLSLDIKDCIVDCTDIDTGLEYISKIYNPKLQNKHSCLAIKFC